MNTGALIKSKINNMKKLEKEGMVYLIHTDEETFVTSAVEFREEHYSLAEDLHSLYDDDGLSKCTPIMVSNDKKSLLFCVNLNDRIERGDNKYRIIIEKI